jgi:hypothetical protein
MSAISCILASSFTPWVATPMVVHEMLSAFIFPSAVRPPALSCGSPSEITMVCLTASPCCGSDSVSYAAFRNGSKSIMSPGTILSILAFSRPLSSPTCSNGMCHFVEPS